MNLLPLAMFNSGADMMIILVVVLVLFGGSKIPELMRGVGKGMGELQKGLEDAKQTLYQASQEVHVDHSISSTPKAPE